MPWWGWLLIGLVILKTAGLMWLWARVVDAAFAPEYARLDQEDAKLNRIWLKLGRDEALTPAERKFLELP